MSWKGRKVLITAGPTREHLDPIRFLTNASSGAMGFALAKAARGLGARVVVVSGPAEIPLLRGVAVRPVTTARQMRGEVLKRSGACDVFIAAAAVGDWRFAKVSSRKIKKTGHPLTLTLIPNRDIVADVARSRPRPLVVGFALETHDALAHARRKLKAKKLDWIVANGPESLSGPRARLSVIDKSGRVHSLPSLPKSRAARKVLDLIGRELECRN